MRWFFYVLFFNVHAVISAPSESPHRLSDPVEMLRTTLLVGLIQNTSTAAVQAITPIVLHTFNAVRNLVLFSASIVQKGFNRLCRRPNPVKVDEIAVWYSILESIVGTACEQSINGTILFKNMPEEMQEMGIDVAPHWQYYVQFVSRIFLHIATYFEQRISYYKVTSEQYKFLVSLSDMFSLDDKASIAFVCQIIIDNMHHMKDVCQQAQSYEDIDRDHLKKVSRNTLLLLKQLTGMISHYSGVGIETGSHRLFPTSSVDGC